MIKENNNTSTKKAGLPDAAQKAKNKKLTLVVMGVVIVVAICMYVYNKTTSKVSQPIEETYTVNADGINEEITASINKKSVTSDVSKQDSKPPQEVTREQIAFIQQKQNELQQRLAAPLMVVNNNAINKFENVETSNPSHNSTDANTQFMNQVSSQKSEATKATMIGPLNIIVAQGSFIHAILESAIHSDLPGFLRASVSQPTYSEDGTQVLIPQGSRLIGQYKSGMLQGQSRIFIVWTKVITPSGISINLGSTGVDSLGVAGSEADEIDRHFWARFGTASLLSIIGTGASQVSAANPDRENPTSIYRSGVANSFAESADQSLQQDKNIPPTLRTYQGKPIMVFVARDLNFESVMKQAHSKINIL